MSAPHSPTPVAVFCAFAQPDLPSCLQLERALKPAQRQGVLTLWHEGHIPGGMGRTEAIETHLISATLILLLVSPDFLDSDECDALMQRALERYAASEAHVIPILLRPADLQDMLIAELAPLPTNLRPISSWPNQDEAWYDVVAGIRRAIRELGQLASRQAERVQRATQRSPQAWTVPYPRNPLFTGREDLLADLAAAFRQGQESWQPQALSGLGGVGKHSSLSSTPIGTASATRPCSGREPRAAKTSPPRCLPWRKPYTFLKAANAMQRSSCKP